MVERMDGHNKGQNKLLERSEMKRLEKMKLDRARHDVKTHADFLDRFRSSEQLSIHAHRVEHHGANFWHYYYTGEPPVAVLVDRGLPEHEYGTSDERKSAVDHMLFSALAEHSVPDNNYAQYDGQPEIESQRRWLDHILLGNTAIKTGNYKEAQENFQVGLAEAEKWGPGDVRLRQTLIALAEAYAVQGKQTEAQSIYSRIADIGAINS